MILGSFLSHPVKHLPHRLPVLSSRLYTVTVQKGIYDVGDLDIVREQGVKFLPYQPCKIFLEARDQGFLSFVGQIAVYLRIDALESGHLDRDFVYSGEMGQSAARSLCEA